MARREDFMEALDAIETGMCRIKESRGIWQNDLVYALCQGVRMLLMEELRHGIPVEAPSPAADVAPVVHGRWLYVDTDTEHFFLCNRCKKKEYWESNYCPACGAKMDGGEQHQ